MNYSIWYSTGIIHSLIIFFVPAYVFRYGILNSTGWNGDMWSISVTSFSSVIFVIILFWFILGCDFEVNCIHQILYKIPLYCNFYPELTSILFLHLGLQLSKFFIYDIHSEHITLITTLLPYSSCDMRIYIHSRFILSWNIIQFVNNSCWFS